MTDEKPLTTAAIQAVAASKEGVAAVYRDLLSRPLRAVSGIASPPLEWLASGVARIFGNKVPGDITEPPAHIMGPVAIGFVLSQDSDELRSMFARLLASSMEGAQIHPAFAEIIRQLSPIEARLIRQLRDKGYCAEEALHKKIRDTPKLIDYDEEWLGSAVDVAVTAGDTVHHLFGAYQNNLLRLGLVVRLEELRDQFVDTENRLKLREALRSAHLGKVAPYNEELEQLSLNLRAADSPASFYTSPRFSWSAWRVALTAFGVAFVEAAIPGDEWSW